MSKGQTPISSIGITFLLCIILFSPLPGLFAQRANVFEIGDIPQEGILLNKGWKFHTGDNPDYAKPQIDDSTWEEIDPNINVNDLPQAVRSGICWLRLRLLTHSELNKEPLAFFIDQNVASEIYLNGRLIYRFGAVSNNPEEVVAVTPLDKPFVLPADNITEQVIAIRFAVQPKLKYTANFDVASSLLQMRLYPVNAAFEHVRRIERHLPVTNSFRTGAFVILAALHLAFFMYNPKQKAYLFFFLYAIFIIPGDILQMNHPSVLQSLKSVIATYFILWQISTMLLLTALHFLLRQKFGWVYWSLLIATAAGFFIDSWVYSILLIGNLVNLELVRTALKALKLKTKGSWIMAGGAIAFLIFQGAFVVGAHFQSGFWLAHLGEIYTMADLLYALGSFSIPLATTIYIGLDFAFTSQALKQKLGEVEKLSKLTIEQEQEKRRIISTVNDTLEKQVSERTNALSQSLENLRSTQSQLIHAEKMASLGELTAGIAHEIQNPLNFVNNFSEINEELLSEMKGELSRGKIVDALVLADSAIDNQKKINHHGKRADAIVKGMLQHSRISNGIKESTDVNALASEYLRLAYHGLRAKDKSFNATLKIDLDETVGKIDVVPQDIGRVILNLITNAFHAVGEKMKQQPLDYEPTVSLSTKRSGRSVLIKLGDNGNGIPQKVLDKIFQPFFTTKPAGQGTGLGLSLSYDIMKAHGGTLKVETREGEGSEFVVELRLSDPV